jgi:hypothetical protein
VPAELVTALFGGGSSTRYYVGVVPPGWPAELVPTPPMAVSGGMQNGSRLAAVFADSSTRHPADSIRKRLEVAGWVRPPDERPQGFEAHGFQSSEPRYWFWCRDSLRASIASTAASGLTYVRVNLDPVRGQPCMPGVSSVSSVSSGSGVASASSMRRMSLPPLALPSLPPPPGLYATRSGGGSSSDGSMNASTQLADSTMSAAAVLAHYAAQLAKGGWTVYPATTADLFAVQPLQARDKDGAVWYGMLTVLPSAKTREVTITMTRLEAR